VEEIPTFEILTGATTVCIHLINPGSISDQGQSYFINKVIYFLLYFFYLIWMS